MPLAHLAVSSYCDGLPDNEGAADRAIGKVESFHRSLGL